MRSGAFFRILVCLISAGALALAACGGGDENTRREVTWTPNDRLPLSAAHWWWEPTERACEDDADCPGAERCQLMRLGTCPGCPRGEDVRICIPRDSGGQNASR